METLFVGKNIIFLPVTDSTNSYAIELLKNVNPPEGTVVHAARQLHGKGQRGSTWTARPDCNLTVSVILKPSFLDLKNHFFLYIVAALACYDTTAEILNTGQFDIKIKWPNDILVNRKKIAGILIENKLLNSRLNYAVIGIGLNVNQRVFEGLNATSLAIEQSDDTDIQNCLGLICRHLEKYYLLLKNQKFEQLKELYTSRLFGLNETLEFEFRESVQPLTVRGIGESGLLILEDHRMQFEVDLKEVKWIF